MGESKSSTGSSGASTSTVITRGAGVNKQLTVNTRALYKYTSVLGIRLPLAYIELYRQHIAPSREKREALKQIIMAAIRQLAAIDMDGLGGSRIEVNMPVTINLQVKAEAKVDLRDAVRELREIAEALTKSSVIYGGQAKRLAKRLEKVMQRLEVN